MVTIHSLSNTIDRNWSVSVINDINNHANEINPDV